MASRRATHHTKATLGQKKLGLIRAFRSIPCHIAFVTMLFLFFCLGGGGGGASGVSVRGGDVLAAAGDGVR